MVTVGIDEAGRGCWAGPLVAAAVVLSEPVAGLKDSKQLTSLQRTMLAEIIRQRGRVGVGWVSPAEVDELGLTSAVSQAMRSALDQLDMTPERIIIDGNYNYLPGVPQVETLVKADALVPEVSAASIIAKTERDAYMQRIAADYPQYQFDKHVGYGTALHRQMLELHGVSRLHRRSYKPVKLLIGG